MTRLSERTLAIVGLHKSGETVFDISKKIGISRKAVEKCLATYERLEPELIAEESNRTLRPDYTLRNQEIVDKYVGGLSSYELSEEYHISARQVQRIVNKAGKARTKSESFVLAIKSGRMKYYHKPEHLLKKNNRKTVQGPLRYAVLERDKHTCQSCGSTVKDGIRLEIDHIDEDPTNNAMENLQVLCNICNQGKSYSKA